MRIGFCVSGEGRVVEAIFEARNSGLLKLEDACALVDRPTRFPEIAARNRVPFRTVFRKPNENRSAYRERLAEEICGLPVDGLFLTFDWLLPPSVVEKFDPNILNLHMSLLPLFPGRGAIGRAHASGMSFAGSTVHRVDLGMDTGPIVGQAITDMHAEMTEAQLGRSLFKASVPLCIQCIRRLESGDLGPVINRRVVIDGARYDGGNFSPSIDRDVSEFSREFLRTRYPD